MHGMCIDTPPAFASIINSHSILRRYETIFDRVMSAEEKKSLDIAKRYYKSLAVLANKHSNCVLGSAKIMATTTDEPAETVAKAAVAACYEDRVKFNALHKAYGIRETTIDEWEADENAGLKFVILEVIKQRALIRSQPAKPHETPL